MERRWRLCSVVQAILVLVCGAFTLWFNLPCRNLKKKRDFFLKAILYFCTGMASSSLLTPFRTSTIVIVFEPVSGSFGFPHAYAKYAYLVIQIIKLRFWFHFDSILIPLQDFLYIEIHMAWASKMYHVSEDLPTHISVIIFINNVTASPFFSLSPSSKAVVCTK